MCYIENDKYETSNIYCFWYLAFVYMDIKNYDYVLKTLLT